MAELRKDPILGEWIIVAPDRAARPFDHEQGRDHEHDGTAATDLCPFCKGNETATPDAVLTIPSGNSPDSSPDDWAVRVIPNRYPAVSASAEETSRDEFFERMPATGYHEVIVESPSHDVSLQCLSDDQFVHIVRAWRDRLAVVSSDESIAHTMIFKNEGSAAGASLEHVHSQLLATTFVPAAIESELAAGHAHFQRTGSNVWSDVLDRELAERARIVSSDDQFVLLCPFASRFSGQMQIVPRRPMPGFESTCETELQDFAGLLKQAVGCFHRVFPEAPFNLGLHTAPPRDSRRDSYRWHLMITPRLTGIAGFEIGSGSWINVSTPEESANQYRNDIKSP
jgi:UDPglucose--hexose-1-phosphate uridylyltransferase